MFTADDNFGGMLLGEEVRRRYAAGQTDYSMEPLVRFDAGGKPIGRIQAGDAVIFCCRRGEREVELTEAFTDPDFPYFDRPTIEDLNFVILTLYHEKFKDLPVAFAPVNVQQTLAEAVSIAGRSQLHCAESEKYAHVTFFLNGGSNQAFPGERDVRVPSPAGVPFETIPQLSLPLVGERVIEALQHKTDLVIVNFANGDVIGHTANRDAKIRCAEVVDFHLGRVLEAARSNDYVSVVTADHGNLEILYNVDGSPHVSHTENPVPFLLVDPASNRPVQLQDGTLADIAPTLLDIMSIPKPEVMTGKNLVLNPDWGGRRRVLLIILDGWGLGAADETNPVHLAATPVWDRLIETYPMARLQAAGEAVGLQAGKAGNSEAGHMNIGAGRLILQDDVRLDQAMVDGSFFTNDVFLKTMQTVRNRRTRLHLIGLLTEKSSHGSIDYPLALLKLAREQGISEIFLHLIFDGRSTKPGSAPALLEMLENRITEIGVGQIVTGLGRGIALDRDGNYGKIKRAYEALVLGIGTAYSGKAG